jgi:hypothetical protein
MSLNATTPCKMSYGRGCQSLQILNSGYRAGLQQAGHGGI